MLLTIGLSAFNAQLTNAALSTTAKKQAVIKDALAGYLLRYSRLPCPDSDFFAPDGIENRTNGGTEATPPDATLACATVFGILPYRTLGLARTDALDAWENAAVDVFCKLLAAKDQPASRPT